MKTLQDAIIAAGYDLQDNYGWFLEDEDLKPTNEFVSVLMKHLVPLLTLDQLIKLNESRKLELMDQIIELKKELEDLE